MTRWRWCGSFIFFITSITIGTLTTAERADAQMGGTATTESTCNFGMIKGERGQRCTIPIPAGCVVGTVPGTDKPWSNISKGGATTCRFEEATTDWKTRVVGACGKCTSPQCSARFSVMLDCSKG